MTAVDRKLIIKKIYHFLLEKNNKKKCLHDEIITDYIDVDVERCVQINYCAKCWKTLKSG